MKYLLIFLFISLSNKNFAGECILKGEVLHSKVNYAVYGKPISGNFNNITLDTIALVNNKFSITIPCDRAVFVMILFQGRPLKLVIQPGNTINIKLDLSIEKNKRIPIEISGKNWKGQKLWDDYDYWPVSKYENIWAILKGNKAAIIDGVKNEIPTQIQPFKDLFVKGFIDKSFYELISSNIKSLLLFEAIRRIIDKNIREINLPNEVRLYIAEELYKVHNPKDKQLQYGVSSILYAKYYYQFLRAKSFKRYHEDLPDSIINIDGKRLHLIADFANLLLETNLSRKESLIGSHILNYLTMGGASLLKDEIQYFKTIYPGSQYLSMISKCKMEAVERASKELIATSKPSIFPIKFIDETGEIKKLSDPLTSWDAITYVDVWATWCSPCLQEMSYNYELDTFLLKNNIRRLYISIDGKQDSAKWKTVINKMKLGGSHILASEALQQNITEQFGLTSELLAIPIYFIIKSGKVVAKAYRPSELDDLKIQLQEEINKEKIGFKINSLQSVKF